MDSTSPEPQNNAPGCVDNGSGAEGCLSFLSFLSSLPSLSFIPFWCVCSLNGADTFIGVMLMAKAFANYTTERTIHFILWGAEEQGLVGSNFYVDNLDQTGYNVVYSLIMDMIGYSNVYHGVKIETSSSVSIFYLFYYYYYYSFFFIFLFFFFSSLFFFFFFSSLFLFFFYFIFIIFIFYLFFFFFFFFFSFFN